jgi:hypothetical protein
VEKVERKGTERRGMGESPENGKESSHSADANGMNECNACIMTGRTVLFYFVLFEYQFHKLIICNPYFHRFTVHFDSLIFFTPTHALSHTTMY